MPMARRIRQSVSAIDDNPNDQGIITVSTT
jgi:hypothetical protein